MSISSVYSNSGTFATADIITATMKNSLNNIHVIDDTSVVAVNTTNAQVYTNSGSGYVSQITHASTSDVVGFSKEFILGTNLYIYNTTQPVSNTRWNTGTDTKYSVSLGSLGSITNNTFFQVRVRANSSDGDGRWSSYHPITNPLATSPNGVLSSTT